MKKFIIAESILRSLDKQNTIFGRGNMEIYSARSSEEILNMQRDRKADIIITESTLPEMGGAQLCAAIRSDADLRGVSIIIVCDGSEASRFQCGEAKANAVVSKPVDPVELFTKVSELLVVPQRKDIRSFLHVSVNGREGSKSFLGVSNNISMSGLSLESDSMLEKGQRITCAFAIGGREIAAEGVIMRMEQTSPGKFRYGLKFLNLDTKSLVIIEQFVKGNIRH